MCFLLNLNFFLGILGFTLDLIRQEKLCLCFACVVTVGTFVMAPAEPGDPAWLCVTLHRGADLAQRKGGGRDRL